MPVEDDHLRALYTAFATCEGPEEFGRFLKDLCTRQEIDAFAERWWIARLLHQGGLSYRDISQMTGASTTTIGRVARFLQQEPHEGYKLVLNRTLSNPHTPTVSRETLKEKP